MQHTCAVHGYSMSDNNLTMRFSSELMHAPIRVVKTRGGESTGAPCLSTRNQRPQNAVCCKGNKQQNINRTIISLK